MPIFHPANTIARQDKAIRECLGFVSAIQPLGVGVGIGIGIEFFFVQGRFANRPYGEAMVLSLGVNMGKALVFWGRGLPNYFFDTDPDTDPEKKLHAIALREEVITVHKLYIKFMACWLSILISISTLMATTTSKTKCDCPVGQTKCT